MAAIPGNFAAFTDDDGNQIRVSVKYLEFLGRERAGNLKGISIEQIFSQYGGNIIYANLERQTANDYIGIAGNFYDWVHNAVYLFTFDDLPTGSDPIRVSMDLGLNYITLSEEDAMTDFAPADITLVYPSIYAFGYTEAVGYYDGVLVPFAGYFGNSSPGSGAADVFQIALTRGSLNDYTGSATVPLTSYLTDAVYFFSFDHKPTSTDPIRVNIDGLGYITIKKPDATTNMPSSGLKIEAPSLYEFAYTGSVFVPESKIAIKESGMDNPMTTLGDMIYAEDNDGTPQRFGGNITTTKKWLSQTGDGAASAQPTWEQVAFADITGTATVSQGGTGTNSFTAYTVICAGTTSTGAFQNVSGTGTMGYVLTSNGAGALPSWQAAAGGGAALSAITAGVATNSIDSTNYAQTWAWSTAATELPFTWTANALTTGTLFTLSSTSTAGDTSKLLQLTRSGTNGTSSKTNYGSYVSIANTGTTSTNVAGYFSASGGTNNYGIIVNSGRVGILTTTPTFDLHVAGQAFFNINSSSTYQGVVMKNSNISGQTNIIFQDSAGTEKMAIGYRNASAGNPNLLQLITIAGQGLTLDSSTGRAFFGSGAVAGLSAYSLTVECGLGSVAASGLALKRISSGANAGSTVGFWAQNSSATYVEYAYYFGAIESNTAGAHTGYLGFYTATAGVVTEKVRLNSSGDLNITTTANFVYRTTNGGSDLTGKLLIDAAGSSTAGNAFFFDSTNGFVFTRGNGTRRIGRTAIQLSTSNDTAGSEDGRMNFLTQDAGAAMSIKMGITAQGSVLLAVAGALGTTATDGFTYIPTCAGTPTGVPTTQTGMRAMVWDSTNFKLYVYDNSVWNAMN